MINVSKLYKFKLSGSALLRINWEERPNWLEFDNIDILLHYIKDGGSALREINHTILAKVNWFKWERITLYDLYLQNYFDVKITKDSISDIYNWKK